MGTYLIAEIAERTGFAATTLRYYEQIGLLGAPQRTSAGYRVYDDVDVARLGFIARAKQLGVSLDELRELVGLWDDERCPPVQERLARMVEAKLARTRARMAELTELTAHLQDMASRLAADGHDGPCDDACACVADTTHDRPLTDVGRPFSPEAVPMACTLEAAQLPGRVDDWNRLLARAQQRLPLPDGLRLHFPNDVGLAGEIVALAAAEQACCGFFEFSLRLSTAGPVLDVRAPAASSEVFAAVFGVAD